MSDGVLTALVVTLPAIIAAVAAFIQSRKNGVAQRVDAIKKDDALQQIHVLVNSRLTEALEEIAALKETIAALVLQDRNKAQAAVDAAKAADAGAVVSTIVPPAAGDAALSIPVRRDYHAPAPPIPRAPLIPPGIP